MTQLRTVQAPDQGREVPKRSRRPLGVLVGWIIGGLVASWVFAFLSGLFPYIGYETGRLEGPAAAKMYSDGTYATDGFGFTKFLFLSGQRVFFEYDADIFSGALRVSVMKPGLPQSLREHIIRDSGKGRFQVPIASTGVYELAISPAPDPDTSATPRMTYSVRWGAL